MLTSILKRNKPPRPRRRLAGDAAAGTFLTVVGLAFAAAAVTGRGKEWLATKFLNRGAAPAVLDAVTASRTLNEQRDSQTAAQVITNAARQVAGLSPLPSASSSTPIATAVGVVRDAFGTNAGYADPAPGARLNPGGNYKDVTRPDHLGVDLTGSTGQVVYATAAGTVTAVNTSDECGGRVEITHDNGLITGYCHQNPGVTVGQTVRRGQPVSRMAAPGSAGAGNGKAPHVHVYIKSNGVRINPTPYIGRTPAAATAPGRSTAPPPGRRIEAPATAGPPSQSSRNAYAELVAQARRIAAGLVG